MADIHDLFDTFHDKISLSTSKTQQLKTSRDSLRSDIKKWFEEHNKKKPSFCMQGSFAMKTTVIPSANNEYDLDDGVYLAGQTDNIDDWPATATVHSWIMSAVDGHTKEQPIDKNTCVRVVYASGYHIDYPIYILKDDDAYLAHKKDGWIISDPKSFKTWFIEHVTEEGEQLRRTVKFLKAWKDNCDINLSGIEITILATENFEAYEGRDEKCLLNTLSKIITSLESDFKCIKPVAPGEDLFTGYAQSKIDSILNGLRDLKSKLELAIDEKDPSVASDYMIEAFGERFPKGEPIQKDNGSTFIRTKNPGVLKHDGRSA